MKKIVPFFLFALLLGCKEERLQLKNTNWKVVSLTIDSINTLNSTELNVVSIADSLMKTSSMFSLFTEDKIVTHLEGKIPDTTNYTRNDDTLFYIQNDLRDTNIIVKINDSIFVTRSLSGIHTHYIKVSL